MSERTAETNRKPATQPAEMPHLLVDGRPADRGGELLRLNASLQPITNGPGLLSIPARLLNANGHLRPITDGPGILEAVRNFKVGDATSIQANPTRQPGPITDGPGFLKALEGFKPGDPATLQSDPKRK